MREQIKKKVDNAIQKLKTASEMSEAYYKKPLIITYSGGKDSDVLLHLALESDINFEVVHSHTTLDAPDTVYHIRETQKMLADKGIKMEIISPSYQGKPTSMWDLIVKNGTVPTRIQRYCCKILKETTIPNRLIALGVRREESSGRKDRDDFEIRGKTKEDAKRYSIIHTRNVFEDAKNVSKELNTAIEEENAYDCTLIKACKDNKNVMVNPIIDWTFEDIWEYIEERKIKYNPLYDMGYLRVGCIGCPMATYKQKMKQFNDFPAYKRNFILAIDRMLKDRKEKGNPWIFKNGKECKTAEELFAWWIEEEKNVFSKDQMSFTFENNVVNL